MDSLEAIERLVRQARREQVPAVDVAGAVLEGVRARRPASVLPLSVVAAGAALAAAVILALAVQAWTTGADPQAALFPTLEIGML
jgi:hypothetical protein